MTSRTPTGGRVGRLGIVLLALATPAVAAAAAALRGPDFIRALPPSAPAQPDLPIRLPSVPAPPAKEEVVARDPRLPPPGTVLTRAHGGVDHQVVVLEEGFEYQGQRFPTLSKIAKEITGTNWNGFLFFKLQRRTRGKATGGAA